MRPNTQQNIEESGDASSFLRSLTEYFRRSAYMALGKRIAQEKGLVQEQQPEEDLELDNELALKQRMTPEEQWQSLRAKFKATFAAPKPEQNPAPQPELKNRHRYTPFDTRPRMRVNS